MVTLEKEVGRPRANWFNLPKSVAEAVYANAPNGDANYFVTQAVMFYLANRDKARSLDKERYQRHYREALKRERPK